jgi:hypothetical protein
MNMRRLATLTLVAAALCSRVALAQAAWPTLGPPPAGGGGAGDAAVIAATERPAFIPPIPGAHANAEAWFEHLTRARGIAVERVTLLRDLQVTTGKLRRFLAAAAETARPGGTLWFVFIGHGAPAPDGKDGLLVGADAQQDVDTLAERSLPRREVLAILGRSKAARIVVVLDACFSGRGGDGRPLAPGLQPLVVTKEAGGLDPRVVLLTAAKSDEFAGPLPGAGRPAFSYLLLGALRGWARDRGTGEVTAAAAYTYAARALRATVTDRTQTPTLAGAGSAVLGRGFERGPDLARLVVATTRAAAVVPAPAPAVAPAPAPAVAPGVLPVTLPAPPRPDVRVLLARCETKRHGPSCARAGEAYRLAQGVPRSYTKAAALYLRGCDLNDAESCARLGDAYTYATGVPHDRERAMALYRQACDRGHQDACVSHARELAIVGPEHPEAVFRALETGCRKGVAAGCFLGSPASRARLRCAEGSRAGAPHA